MKILLDTCTFLWLTLDAPELSAVARSLVLSEDNDLFLSAVSAFEISVKFSLGKLHLPESPDRFIPSRREILGVQTLAIEEGHAAHLCKLPAYHQDPFDRLLVCQAIFGGLKILSPDPLLIQYPAPVIW